MTGRLCWPRGLSSHYLRHDLRVKPQHAVLTNLHLDLDYDALKQQLPANLEPAYDGLVIRAAL